MSSAGKLDFTAIDFETATARPNSACSVAVVEVKDGEPSRSYYTLIRPPGLYFLSCNIKIHGITPKMVEKERDFAGIWEELRPFLEDHIVVAHNAPFDMGVLKSSLSAAKIPFPNFFHCCTVQIARKAWPDLKSHKLNVMGDFLGIDFHHHNALEDARVCAEIPIAAAQCVGADDFVTLVSRLKVAVKQFGV